MVAIDTNVLVRFLTGDDDGQFKAGLKLFSTEQVFIPDTVVLETEWVLRAAYDLEPNVVCEALRRVFGLPNVRLANGQRIARAIDWHELGLDFADSLHLASCQDLESLRTFDLDFIKRARRLGECRVERP